MEAAEVLQGVTMVERGVSRLLTVAFEDVKGGSSIMAFGFFDRIKDGLEKTRKSFVKNVESIVIGYAQIDDDFFR